MATAQSFGSYLLFERLGVGARSEVLRARPRAGGDAVALKRILSGFAKEQALAETLLAEASLLGKLAHPGVPRVVEVGRADGLPFVAYDLLPGADLESVVARARERKHPLGLEVALALGIAVGSVLAYVHQAAEAGRPLALIHRDVTPSNVVVGFDGRVKLVDFGIARVAGQNRTTGVGEIKGTVRYMSPEQVRGEELDPRSDLYSLGVVVLELAAGKPAFEGVRPVDVLTQVSLGRLPDPGVVAPGLPGEVAAILRKVLAKSPAERYDTAAHLVEALRGAAGALGITADGSALARAMVHLFPVEAQKSAASEESPIMAEDKGGSDLDVFEGLAKKSSRSSTLSGGPVSVKPAPPPPPAASGKSTLLGVPAPHTQPPVISQVPPPSIKPPNLPPPASRAGSSPAIPAARPGSSPALPPPSLPAPNAPPGLPAPGATATPLPAPNLPPPAVPPPPASTAAPQTQAPQTLIAAVAPPPKPAPSIGSQLGIPKAEESLEELTPAESSAGEGARKKGASVDMDWEDEEESTHVFEKQKHGLAPTGPRPAAGAAAEPMPASLKVGSAAALLAGSGGAAAPMSVPAPAPLPAPQLPPPAAVPAQPPPAAFPVAATAMGGQRRPSDEATIVRPRDGGGSKLGVILGALALVAVVVLGVFMFMPRTGQLKIELKSKSGKSVARAEIFVDGQLRCQTAPCVVDELSPGSKTIKVIAEGAEPSDEKATVEAGKEKVVFITVDDGDAPSTPSKPAKPEGTGFVAQSSQAGVTVSVDGAAKGNLPASITDLAPGEHTLKFEGGERYQAVEKKITVASGKVEDLGEIKLKVLKGRLTLELKTEGADVVLSSTIDGKKVEKKLANSVWKSPPVRIDIDTKDQWRLVATKKGLGEFARDISFDDGAAEKTIVIELADQSAPVVELTAAPPTPGPGPTPGPTPTAAPGPKDPPKDPPKPEASGNGTLNMNSIPISKVVLDGRPMGSTPQSASVAAGSHTVTFIHPEKGRKSKTVTVKAGQTATAAVKFE